jgi:hypothetical protein
MHKFFLPDLLIPNVRTVLQAHFVLLYSSLRNQGYIETLCDLVEWSFT